jgi:hypothetical protein
MEYDVLLQKLNATTFMHVRRKILQNMLTLVNSKDGRIPCRVCHAKSYGKIRYFYPLHTKRTEAVYKALLVNSPYKYEIDVPANIAGSYMVIQISCTKKGEIVNEHDVVGYLVKQVAGPEKSKNDKNAVA